MKPNSLLRAGFCLLVAASVGLGVAAEPAAKTAPDGSPTGRLLRLDGRRIDRIVFAATKADHLHQANHDRLEAILRRPSNLVGSSLQLGNLVFDTASRQAFINDEPQYLSSRESAVLELLIRRRGHVVSKRLLEDELFGLFNEIASNAIEVYVHRLRKKLEPGGVRIVTVRGLGYSLEKSPA